MNLLDSNREREDEVYFAAVGIAEPKERASYLDEACARNPALRKVVEEMLASQEEAEELITRAAAGLAGAMVEIKASFPADGASRCDLDEVVGTRIDRYKILQRLGDGGCGAVYMAEQELPVRRRVALKVIKLGMDTESVIARFETERQMLAMMDHPNIAHVLDAGATDEGGPYFVMELVSGTKITDYCDQHKLRVNERLKLFIEVCHAVQHAHQKGIIHRDLKPSNILVTLRDGKPVPKVIDFGVAKAMQTNVIGHNVTTASGQLIGTPAYMSPEQAALRGVDVDTRSDIYSLGVLLYELLSGQTPFDRKELLSGGLDQMRKTLRETEPKRPSAKLATLEHTALQKVAARRSTTVPSLISEVEGDLDWIVMKALEKDLARRYGTANGLLRDVERYLEQEPVVARPQTRIYRLRKLVRRNWLVFAAGTAVVLALAAGLGASVWLLFRERELRQRAVAAEQEQARLREIAERGLANETELRRQSEAREAIVQAAALINQQDFAKSDELMAKVPLGNPTLEGVQVFRTLGDWNAVRGNWHAARDRYCQLRYANRIENAGDTSLDITRAAVTYIECNDAKGYEEFRQRVMETYAGTTDPAVAERVVKNCLLRPDSEPLLKALTPFVEVARQLLSGRDYAAPQTDGRVPWCCLSVALLEYRSGNWMESATWSRRCLHLGEQPAARAAGAQAILAMDLFYSGQVAEARSELAKARTTVDARLKNELQPYTENVFWFDWILARILVREAETVVSQ
jgi:eukaryotic-like serine/threonine-protein kinase